MTPRRKTRTIQAGSIAIGGDSLISVQSMTNTDTRDVESTTAQIHRLESAGCEIVRLAVPDMEAAEKIKEIKKRVTAPLIADIHFDFRLALKAIEGGVDGLRINPGNIGSEEKVGKVVSLAKDCGVPIRIGVNAGSLEKGLEQKTGSVPKAMLESAKRHIGILEKLNFHDIKISLKASDVTETIEAYRLLAKEVDYPFHIGISEAGTLESGTIKSSVGLGILLSEGIGDTLRVSLSADPVEEVRVGFGILKAIGLRERGVDLVSCPTCSRQEIDVISLAREVEKALSAIKTPLQVAVMGCVVNGPGEARKADIAVCGGKGIGVLYKNGEIIKKVKREDLISELLGEIEFMTGESKKKLLP